ncbi:hypothetical protein RclHR1_08970002 [Rhizophagus clarus]|uniref:Ion transport domain-containing protein n=1 Tax=Rhizophagus clarus TaxID=94130 RepID=A0A2Z6SHB1_9GLOM|nr:hypothetical protein RclHR1_08970002 [Rhizophagus clarus]GES84886.1 hypothetical protein GLOIN_2v1731430 [Rhizophagus clarus]
MDNRYSIYVPRDPHNGGQISLVSLSLDGEYVVTYSYNDTSIEGWIVEGSKLTLEFQKIELPKESGFINDIKVNNSKIVCYALGSETKTFPMPNINNSIKLNPPPKVQRPRINFTKDGNLVIFDNNKILVYSTDGKTMGKMISSYEILSYNEVIKGVFIDGNDNIWGISPNHLFHWDLKTFQLKFNYSLGFTDDGIDEIDKRFTVISKGNSIVVKYNNEIATFSEGVHFPIQNIKLKDTTNIKKIKLCEIQNNDYLLAFNLPEKYEKQNEKNEKQNVFLYHISDINKQPIDVSEIFNKDHPEDKFYEYNSDIKKAFGLVNGKFSCINVDFDQEFPESHKVFFESHKDDADFVSWNNYLYQEYQGSYCNDTLAFPDMKKLRDLISDDCKYIDEIDETDGIEIDKINKIININFKKNSKYKWRIDPNNKKLSVYTDKEDKEAEYDYDDEDKDKEVRICSKNLDNNSWNLKWRWEILNNDALALRYYGNCTGDTIIIYNYDIKNKTIKFEYYYKKGFAKLNTKEFSGLMLPISTDLDKKILIELINSIIEDDRCLAKYGQTLLPILIESSDSDLTRLMEDIYKKCMKLVKEDPKRNLKFLNIITSSMNKLNKSHFDYITRFNSEMFMILDPFNESVNNKKDHSHFYTFSQEIEIIGAKYSNFFYKPFQNLISDSLMNTLRNFLIERKAIQYITLIVPYVDYSRYPSDYNFWWEIILPQPSVFIKTCKKNEFYTNWNGEAVVKFKWKTFGKTYYCFIWLIFMVFLVCFTIASYPTNSLTQEIRIKLYKTSFAFGIFHLFFELRQFIWNPKKYISSIWNLFDLSAYIPATIASIYYVKHNNVPEWILSVSCLLLDIRFLLFFRIIELFGIYSAIIFGVARRVFSFLVVLAIIILSFAHAFFLLLHPQDFLNSLNAQDSNDPNNPWTLSNTYNQTDENGNILNETLIQVPSENTNLFYSYSTSLLATYLFLTGNQNSFSPWTPKLSTEYTTLFALMAVFSFIVVIYLMNLFIGLLNMEIENNNSRAEYLAQKAEAIAEIELFYLLPHQRRRRSWFPEVIYYHVDVEKARIYIKESINKGEWKRDDWPEMKHKILKLLSIEDVIIDQAV